MRQRWEDVTVRVYVDGVELQALKATSFDFESMVREEMVKYAGESVPTMDADFEGWRFSFDTELSAGTGNLEDAFEQYLQGVIDRDASGRIRLVVTGRIPGSSTRGARRFDDCQINVRFKGTSGRANVRSLTGRCPVSQVI